MVKVYEVVYAVVFQRGGVLAFEQAGCDVEHSATRIAFFYSDTYCLDEVGFAHAGRTEDEQRVECLALRVGGDGFANGACHPVADTVAVVFESIAGVELRVYVCAFYRSVERIGGCSGFRRDGRTRI